MAVFTKHLALNKATSSDASESVIDRSNQQPIRWFTVTVDQDAYIGINGDASASELKLLAGESYTTPEKIRVVKITVMRATDNNVTVRGSAWF